MNESILKPTCCCFEIGSSDVQVVGVFSDRAVLAPYHHDISTNFFEVMRVFLILLKKPRQISQRTGA